MRLWGRQTSYIDRDDFLRTTTYPTAGQFASVADPYDSFTEHRGLVTSKNISGSGQFNSTYDAGGRPMIQNFATMRIRTNSNDRAGQTTGITYPSSVGTLASRKTGYDIQEESQSNLVPMPRARRVSRH